MDPVDLEGYARYAVYYAPPAGSPLAALGAAWLGWDAEAGVEVAPDGPAALAGVRPALVKRARRYGFHATLKAPFRLLEGVRPTMLADAVAALAAKHPPAEGPGLMVDDELGFVALRPRRAAPDIDTLAGACVTELDLLRAPLSAAESAKRSGGLDTVEQAHLREWGYPYVLNRFHFHMTLTCQLTRRDARAAADALFHHFAQAIEPQFAIREIALFGDPGEGGPFRLLRRYPLSG